MVNSEASFVDVVTGKSRSDTSITNAAEVTNVTGESEGGETKYVNESADEGETEVDEAVDKVVNTSKSYDIVFKMGGFISY